MIAPPKDCPCGRPRSGGTYVEVDIRSKLIVRVEFMHSDASCAWLREAGGGRRWLRLGDAA